MDHPAAIVCAGVLALALASARAQQAGGAPQDGVAGETPQRSYGWYVQPNVQALESVTDNGGYGGASPVRTADLITDLTAGLDVFGLTPRLQVRGNYTVHALEYARASQGGRVEPSGRLDANFEAVEKHLLIDGSLLSTRVLNNPLSPIPSDQSTLNNTSISVERVAPTLVGQIGSLVKYKLRSENSLTQSDPVDPFHPNAYVSNHSVDLEQTPSVLGLAANAQRTQTHFDTPSAQPLTDNSARAILRFRPWPEFAIGARYGITSNNYGLLPSERLGRIIGGDLAWRPTERTSIEGFVERRLFGHEWDLRASHRTPFLAVSLTSNRTTGTSPLSLLTLTGSGDVSSLLDAIYTTRYPDPIERAQVVNEVITSQGLPATISGPLSVYTQFVSRVSDDRLAIALKGRRNTVEIALYAHRNEVLQGNIAPTAASITTQTDSYQLIGGSAGYTLRLSPTARGTLSAYSNRSTGLGAADGEQTTETVYSLRLGQALSKRLDAVAGAEHRSTHSNFALNAEETAVFAGFAWRMK